MSIKKKINVCPYRHLHLIKLFYIHLRILPNKIYSSAEKQNKKENAAMQWPESDASHCVCIVKSTKIDLVSLYTFILSSFFFFSFQFIMPDLAVQFHKKMRAAIRLQARLLSHRESLSHEMHKLCAPKKRKVFLEEKKNANNPHNKPDS